MTGTSSEVSLKGYPVSSILQFVFGGAGPSFCILISTILLPAVVVIELTFRDWSLWIKVMDLLKGFMDNRKFGNILSTDVPGALWFTIFKTPSTTFTKLSRV